MPPQPYSDLTFPSPRPLANVVVVDDDPDMVDTLSSLLTEQGFVVEGFTDPASALQRLRLGPTPDLVLSDCIMPELSGAELVEALEAAGVDTPVVLMTALSDPGFCVDTGRVRVLGKPFALEDLLAEIDAVTRPVSGIRTIAKSA